MPRFKEMKGMRFPSHSFFFSKEAVFSLRQQTDTSREFPYEIRSSSKRKGNVFFFQGKGVDFFFFFFNGGMNEREDVFKACLPR